MSPAGHAVRTRGQSTPARRTLALTSAVIAAVLVAVLPPAASSSADGPEAGRPDADRSERLANLAHLDFLRADIAPPEQPGHTTYRDGQDPPGFLWTYAEPDADGDYRRVGGGAYDEGTDTYGQGAYNADDISRAAVVYLRHWRAHGDAHSRDQAYALLRGLTYLQTSTGPNAGNVVLWMQPDGTLNPSAEPREEPDPSDSGPSYWLARTVWALGEGYAVFSRTDPAFAAFLDERMQLSLGALRRQVLDSYGRWRVVDGRRVPAWLVADGADATAEAMLGLAAYVEAGGGHQARQVLYKLAEGVAAMGTVGRDDPSRWPYGAVLPWAQSRSVWHAWGGMAPAALAEAADVLDEPALLRPAVADTARFTPHLLAQGGPDNGWLPAPADRSQIAYGTDSRLASLLAVGDAADRPGLRRLAGFAASWYFGNNPAGAQMYDPATGRTFDGVNADRTVNRNSGAESTIHGLLSMLAVDANAGLASDARIADRVGHRSWRLVEAESGSVHGGASVVQPADAWTGESQWSGGAYVAMEDGARLRLGLDVDERSVLMPVVWRHQGATGQSRTSWRSANGALLGRVEHRGAGAQGDSAVPGVAEVATLGGSLSGRAGGTELEVRADSTGGSPAWVDAVLVQPEVERLVVGGAGQSAGHGRALLRSFATGTRTRSVAVPGAGPATVRSYDADGRLVHRQQAGANGSAVSVTVQPGGFTLVER